MSRRACSAAAPARWPRALLAAALALGPACVGDLLDPREPPPPFERYIDGHCAALERCASSHGRAFPSARVCMDYQRSLVECGIEARDPVFHQPVELQWRWLGGDSLDACLEWLDGAGCDEVHDALPRSCRDLLEVVDGLTAGARCGAFEDVCQVGLVCAVPTTDASLCAVCAQAAQAGEPCDPARPACDEGLYCEPNTSSCAARKAAGAPCADDGECRSDSCSGSLCAARRGRGEVCSDNAQCAWELRCVGSACGDGVDEGGGCQHSGQCLRSLYCVDSTCRAYSLCEVKGRGEACPFPLDLCDWDSYCSPITGACEHIPYSYSECSYTSWECLGDLYCDFTESPPECASRKENGEPCTQDVECVTAHCDPSYDTCAAPPACTMP